MIVREEYLNVRLERRAESFDCYKNKEQESDRTAPQNGPHVTTLVRKSEKICAFG